MTPGDFIHGRRRSLGMTLFDLAHAAEITRTRLRGIEDGQRPDYYEAERIAGALCDELDQLQTLLDRTSPLPFKGGAGGGSAASTASAAQ